MTGAEERPRNINGHLKVTMKKIEILNKCIHISCPLAEEQGLFVNERMGCVPGVCVWGGEAAGGNLWAQGPVLLLSCCNCRGMAPTSLGLNVQGRYQMHSGACEAIA